MTKVSSFPTKSNPSPSDTVGGNDNENGKKFVNFTIESIVSLVNSISGKDYITYKFSPNYGSIGLFSSNEAITNPTQITKLFFNKQSVSKEDLTDLFVKLDTLQNIVIDLRNPSNSNNFATFKITNITNQTEYFELDVTLYKSFYSGNLVANTTYSAYFDVKENFEDKLDQGNYVGTAETLKTDIETRQPKVAGKSLVDDTEITKLSHLDDTTDLQKPVSTATAAALALKLATGGYVGTAQDLEDAITAAVTGVTGQALVPSSPAFAGTGIASGIALEPGTYPNHGSVVVNSNSIAVIARDALGNHSITQTALVLTGYVQESDIIDAVDSTEVNKPASANSIRVVNEKVEDLAVGIFSQNITNLANIDGYINNSDNVVADGTWSHTAFLPCVEGNEIYVRIYGHPIVNSITFYNSVYGVLKTESAPAANTVYSITSAAPVNSSYYRVCYQKSYPLDFGPIVNFKSNKIDEINEDLSKVKLALEILPLQKSDVVYEYNSKPFSELVNNGGDLDSVYYVNNQAQIIEQSFLKSIAFKSTGTSTAYIKCVKIIEGAGGTYTFEKLHDFIPILIANGSNSYDIDDSFIMPAGSFIAVNCATLYYKDYFPEVNNTNFRIIKSDNTVTTTTVIIGYNISVFLTEPSTEILDKNQADLLYEEKKEALIAPSYKRKVPLFSTSKIILYGDSRFSTDYPWLKSELELATGAIVNNAGYSGQTAAFLASNSALNTIFSYNPNVIVIMIGGNDLGGAGQVGSFALNNISNEPVVSETDISVNYTGTYFIQAISHTIRKVKERYYNIRANANLTGTETEVEKAAKIDAVLKPYIVVCTDLKQKRNPTYGAWSSDANWQRKCNAIIECCLKYKVHCIDLPNLLSWNMDLEPQWESPTDLTTNNGIYTMDGLHPNKYGYEQIAEVLVDHIL